MIDVKPLENESLTALFDQDKKIVRITYKGVLTVNATADAYYWLTVNALKYGVDLALGGIFDFREVTKFQLGTLSILRRERQKSLKQVDFSATPTALVVKDFYQEQMVRVTMRLTEQSNRLQIVYSIEEAEQFIQEWHQLA